MRTSLTCQPSIGPIITFSPKPGPEHSGQLNSCSVYGAYHMPDTLRSRRSSYRPNTDGATYGSCRGVRKSWVPNSTKPTSECIPRDTFEHVETGSEQIDL